MRRITFLMSAVIALLFTFNAQAQNYFETTVIAEKQIQNSIIQANNARYFQVDVMAMKNALQSAPYRETTEWSNSTFFVELPNVDGGFSTYKVLRNQTMHPLLSAVYPNILTFDGVNVNNVLEKVKFDLTPQGFHAMVSAPDHSTLFIDPINPQNPNKVMVYLKKDFHTSKIMQCDFEMAEEKFKKLIDTKDFAPEYGTCQLRTYRLALAATAEYTAYHNGATLAAAAQVTTMNRVNGVFEKDIAITMTLVPNNNLLIYTNAATDPYTNGNAGTMINQNVTNCNAVIGFANYDIGHVFGTNSGGLAGLGVVCGTNKARGVTGSSNPIGDPFDIDYVAHEIGHQFNANHTQNNNCNRNNATAVEPGSASTIMGYAGICAPNVQSNSDDHFHGISLSEINTLITNAGHTCPVVSTLSNSAPVITAGTTSISIPASTPFALTCVATDINGDTLTYNWEQTNNQVSTQPPLATATSGPNFRSFPSSTNPTRYFPKLSSLATGGPYTWEVVPSVARTMNFRCSVRDNFAGPGGCSDHVNVTVSTIATAGPFVVSYPNATGITWPGSSNQTVTWSVANTTAAPINASNVKIYLSTDGGLTYPTLLLASTANDGSESITVPNVTTTTARIMVMSAAGTFFDVSDNNFTITAATLDYTISATPSNVSVCQGVNGTFTINSSAIGPYTTPINLNALNLPAGATANFVPSTITAGQSSTLTISGAPQGTHSITVEGNAAGNIHTVGIVLDVTSSAITTPSILSPTNGAANVTNPTTFTWNAASGASSYSIEISTSPTFAPIVDQATGLTGTSYTSILLNATTTYYWRISAQNTCATSPFVQASYTTGNCLTINSPNVPIAISATGTPTITSAINIPITGFVGSIRIPKVQGTHTSVGQLTVNLISPQGASITLFSGICGSNDNFNLGFDDAATPGAIPCPPTTSSTYQTVGGLSNFIGSAVQGNWTLQIIDGVNNQGGSLDFWSLELCIVATPCFYPQIAGISGPDSICGGDFATLTVSGNLNDATQWEWHANTCGGAPLWTGTTFNVNPTTNTTYYVKGVGGCVTNAACGNKTVAVTNLNTNVVASGNLLSSLQPNSNYQWLLCSSNYAIISGANSATFTPTLGLGSYAVQVSKNGCVDTSACFVVNQLGLDESNAIQFTLAPNPTKDWVEFTWQSGTVMESIEIVDMKGKLVYRVEELSQNTQGVYLGHLESAIYFVRVRHSQGMENIRLIKVD